MSPVTPPSQLESLPPPLPPPYFGIKDLYVHGKGFVMTPAMAAEVDSTGTIRGIPVDIPVRNMAVETMAAQRAAHSGGSASSQS